MYRLALRRIRRNVEAAYWRRPVGAVVKLKRRYLTRPTFVGITGTAGKTTTKMLTAAVLNCLGPGVTSPGERKRQDSIEHHSNGFRDMVQSVLRTTQRHQYCVQELAADGPGSLDELVSCFRPDISVVLNVGLEHYSAFRTFEAVAEEKGKLVEALPANGAAVLNADDPRVLAMRERTSADVVTFGLGTNAEIRAENVHSAWPDPLRLAIVCDGRRQPVETQLLGEHWAYAVLAAFAVGRRLGVSPSDAAAAIADVSPVAGRLDPISTPNGVTLLCDDMKFPYWNVGTFLRVVDAAQAQRKLIVFGVMSDFSGNSRAKFRRIAREALEVADVVVFVGERSARYLKSMAGQSERLVLCPHIEDAREYLTRHGGPGDLVVLKGTDTIGRLRCVAGADRLN